VNIEPDATCGEVSGSEFALDAADSSRDFVRGIPPSCRIFSERPRTSFAKLVRKLIDETVEIHLLKA